MRIVTFAVPSLHSPWTRWLVLLGAVLVMAILGVVPQAGAHAELERSDPPSEGLLAVPPQTIEFWFTERVDPGEGSLSLRLLDDQGREYGAANLTVDPDDPRHVTAEVDGLAPGTITAVWTVRSIDDGHTLSGTFTFRVGAGRAPGAATVEGERPPAWAVATRWLTFLGAATAAAGFAFAPVILRGEAEPRRTSGWRARLIAVGVAVALAATTAEPFLQRQWPPAGTTSQSLDAVVAGLPDAWWLRPLALGPCLFIAFAGLQLGGRRAPALTWGGFVLAHVSLLGLSLTSHAAARESWREPAVLSNIVHQWSIALWVGGLVHLWLWWRGRTVVDGSPDAGLPVRRFSRVAPMLVLLGVGTGVVNGGLVLPALRALWASDYGVVLILKVAVLTVPLAFATFNRRALRRSVDALLPAVRSAVRVEAILVLAVVLGGSALALLAPPSVEADKPVVADVPLPALGGYDGQDLLVHLLFSPGEPGENRTGVRITNYDGTPFTGETPALVRLSFSNVLLGGAPVTVEATPEPDGTWSVDGTQLSLPGWWNIDVLVRWIGRPDVSVPFYLLMPDPNLNGLDAPDDDPPNDPAAEALYRSAMERYTSMHRVEYEQSMANQFGTVAYGVHLVNDGADGSTPGFTFDIPGGWHYVVLGETSWSKRPGQPWKQGESNPMIPPAEWDEEYVGARGFQLGRQEAIDGELCQTITFVVPGTPKRVVAWYIWWIEVDSGRVRQEAMISRSHYMYTTLTGVDMPAVIEPPDTTEPEAVATPVR